MTGTVHVIGGGLAGSMAALSLAKAGRAVCLYERTAKPHPKVCGEFLSAEAMLLLGQQAPWVMAAMGELAPPSITKARFTCGSRVADFALPERCWGLARQDLDEALLRATSDAGVEVRRGVKVSDISTLSGNGPTILATGKHQLSGAKRQLRGRENVMIGLKQHYQMAADFPDELSDLIHLFFFDGGYGGFVAINGRRVSLAVAVTKNALSKAGNSLAELMSHCATQDQGLAHWLAHMIPVGEPLAIAQVPYGFVADRPISPHVYAVGDQAAVIPSFSGDGQSVALYSGYWAAQAIVTDQSATEFAKRLARQVRRNVGIAHLFSPLVCRAAIMRLAVPWLSVPGLGSALFSLTRMQTIEK